MKISVITPVYNEWGNVGECIRRVRDIFRCPALHQWTYEHIFADNASTDGTQARLRTWAKDDPRVKVIFNTKNYGAEVSTANAILESTGDYVIILPADCQDPPETIPTMVSRLSWECPVVSGVKKGYLAVDGWVLTLLKAVYYRCLNLLSDEPIPNRVAEFQLVPGYPLRIALTLYTGCWPSLRVIIARIAQGGHAFVPYKVVPRKQGEAKGTGNWGTLFAHAWNDFRCAVHRPQRREWVKEIGRLNF